MHVHTYVFVGRQDRQRRARNRRKDIKMDRNSVFQTPIIARVLGGVTVSTQIEVGNEHSLLVT